MTTKGDISEALNASEKSYSLSADIITDSNQTYIAQDPRSAIDPIAVKNLFYTEDWVYIVCDRIASLISSQWLRVMRDVVTDGKKVSEPAEGHPLQAILEAPNDMQDYHTWMYGVVVDEVLMGNSFIWLAQQANQLYLLPSELTTADLGLDGSVKSYKVSYTQDLKKGLVFNPEEICHIRRPNPSSRIYGMSPFLPGAKAIAFNRFTSEYLNNFYRKGAQPGLVLKLDDVPNEKAALRLLRSFENAYTGRANQHKTAVLPKGVSFEQVSHSLADQQLIEYIRSNRETILNILQVPKHEVGLDGGHSLGAGDEYKVARANFWKGPLKSIMRRISGSLSKFFAEELGQGHFLEFDLSDVDALQEDDQKKADLAQKMLATHTLNEVRSKLYGLEGVPNGDQVQGTQQPLPIFPPLQQQQTLEVDQIDTTEIDPTEKNMERFTLLQKSVGSWFEESDRIFEDGLNNTVPKMMKLVLGTFAKQANAVADVLVKYKSERSYETKDLPDKKELRRKITQALDELEQQYVDGYAPNLESQVELGYGLTFAVAFNEQDELALDAIRERNADGRRMILKVRGIESFKSIGETSIDEVMTTIENGIRDSISIDGIIKNLIRDFSNVENIGKRAEMIARTEALTAASIGQAAALKDAERVVGPMIKMWISAEDKRVRGPNGIYPKSEFNHEINGEVRKSNEKFSTKLMYPREPGGAPGNVINCRCRMVAVAKEDASALGIKLEEDT